MVLLEGGGHPIKKEWSIDAVLTGSVAASRNRVRINIKVVRSDSGELLLAEQYEGQM